MIVDSLDLPGGAVEADVCVVGGGAAGIAVALGLLDSGLRVVLVEGGGRAAADAPRRPPRVVPGRGARPSLAPDPARHWYLGGNTNTWAGNCRPLDEQDLAAREWLPGSGWPLGRAELDPWYERAQALLGLGGLGLYDLAAIRPRLARPPLEVDPAVATTRIMQVCPVPSLADVHRRRLEDAGSLSVLLRAEALRLLTDGGERVAAVEVACAGGRRARVEAGTVVLAAGGVENARLLLASDDAVPGGLGNHHDLVGRCFMDHWWFDVPLGDFGRGRDLGLYAFDSHGRESVDGQELWAQLSLAEEVMRRERVPGLTLWFVRRRLASASVVAAEMLALSALRRVPPDPLTDLRLLLADAPRAPRHLVRRLARRPAPDALTLMVQLEQAAERENRVRLSSRRDALGRREAELALRLTPAERAGHERALAALARELGLDAGRVTQTMRVKLAGRRYDFFWHHVGTTRMNGDPRLGVVDTDCRVHGTSNLFVAGSSVFPTEGTAPPTLTIVALALRLAGHLARPGGG
ncbi:MAG TPA: FAD-dependent oxidoreductase [Gaiellaceae bacterium]|nr:FAD-dependent oxidoreductase [Gaiellaceae bacterium]